MAECSPPVIAPCVECGASQQSEGIPLDLDCRKHRVCRGCVGIRAERLRGDICRCATCPSSVLQSRDSSPAGALEKENVWIYVDDSNIWIEGKKLRAKKQGLKSVEDPRARIDIGHLTDVVAMNNREVVKGTLYGSEPPAVDTVWKKIRDIEGWTVPDPKRRSIVTGKEKKVDSQIVADITQLACKGSAGTKPGTIIIISGDADYTPAIEKVLECQPWKVEVHMWESAMSSDLKHYVKNNRGKYPDLNKRFRVQFLDEHLNTCMFTEFQFQPAPHKHAELMEWGVVITLKPDAFRKTDGYPTKQFNSILSSLTQWPFQHYRLKAAGPGEMTNNLVIYFQPVKGKKFNLAWFMAMLREDEGRMEDLHAENIRTFKQMMEEQKYGEAKNYSLTKEGGGQLQDLYTDLEAVLAPTAEDDSDGEWQRQGPKQMKKKRLYSQHCMYKFNCSNGSSCRYSHLPVEQEYFKKKGGKGNPRRKTLICMNKSRHTAANCEFAHGEDDAWCLICHETGHLTRNCKDYRPEQ